MSSRGAGRYAQSHAELIDCSTHGPGSGAELILVEGESAQKAVAAVRSAKTQAVLPLQGKPLNAWVAPREKVEGQPLFQQLANALGLKSPTELPEKGLSGLRHERLVLLFDPDADGIHIGALIQLYLARWLPDLVDAGAVWLVRAPMFEIVDSQGEVHHALSPAHRDRVLATLTDACRAGVGAEPSRSSDGLQVRSVRGLASLAPSVLARLCVDPATRLARAVTREDLRDVQAVFGSAR